MATVLGMVGSPKRLVLVAAGPLAGIPWAAASDESRTGRRYLIESCSVSSAPSARALRDALRYRPNRPAASLVVGSGVVAERAGAGRSRRTCRVGSTSITGDPRRCISVSGRGRPR
jgi:hypothetical protein